MENANVTETTKATMTKYVAYITGEVQGVSYTFKAENDQAARKHAEQWFNPHNQNFKWYGNVKLANSKTNACWDYTWHEDNFHNAKWHDDPEWSAMWDMFQDD